MHYVSFEYVILDYTITRYCMIIPDLSKILHLIPVIVFIIKMTCAGNQLQKETEY